MPDDDIKIEVNSIDEYIQEIRGITKDKSDYIFRGQADGKWPLQSAAFRRIQGDGETPPTVFADYHTELIDLARRRGHGYDERSRPLHDLEILAKLQHYGAATAFIDFTKNFYVALWFAAESLQDGCDGAVFVIKNDIEKFKQVEESLFSEPDKNEKKVSHYLLGSGDGRNPRGRAQPPYWLWEAQRVRGERIIRQSSIFVFGKPEISEADYAAKIMISEDAKEKIRDELGRLHDISEQSLFPDFSGFAIANSVAKPHKTKSAEEYLQLGNKDFQRGEYQSAISHCTKAIQIDQENAMAYQLRGISLNNLGNYGQAIADLNKTIEIDPEIPSAYHNRAISYQALGNHDQGIADCSKAIELDPEIATTHFNRGISYQVLGNHAQAALDFDNAIDLDPTFAVAYHNRGVCHQALGNHDKAIVDFDKTIELAPKVADVYHHRGGSHQALGNHDKAMADFNKAVELNPGFAAIYHSQEIGNDPLDDYDQVIANCTKALELDPENANAYSVRGFVRHQNNQQEGWDKDLRTALRLAKTQGDAELEKRMRETMLAFGMSEPK